MLKPWDVLKYLFVTTIVLGPSALADSHVWQIGPDGQAHCYSYDSDGSLLNAGSPDNDKNCGSAPYVFAWELNPEDQVACFEFLNKVDAQNVANGGNSVDNSSCNSQPSPATYQLGDDGHCYEYYKNQDGTQSQINNQNPVDASYCSGTNHLASLAARLSGGPAVNHSWVSGSHPYFSSGALGEHALRPEGASVGYSGASSGGGASGGGGGGSSGGGTSGSEHSAQGQSSSSHSLSSGGSGGGYGGGYSGSHYGSSGGYDYSYSSSSSHSYSSSYSGYSGSGHSYGDGETAYSSPVHYGESSSRSSSYERSAPQQPQQKQTIHVWVNPPAAPAAHSAHASQPAHEVKVVSATPNKKVVHSSHADAHAKAKPSRTRKSSAKSSSKKLSSPRTKKQKKLASNKPSLTS